MERIEEAASIEVAASKVRVYIFKHVGNNVAPGTPKFRVSDGAWHVPILCQTERGIFVVGEVLLDEELNFLRVPSKRDMDSVLDAYLRTVPLLVYADKEELEAKGFSPVTLGVK